MPQRALVEGHEARMRTRVQVAAITFANRASMQAKATADHANTDGHRDSARSGVLERLSCTMCIFLHDLHISHDPDMAHMTCEHQFPGISLGCCFLVSTAAFNAPHAVAAASAQKAERSKIASCTGLGGYSATVGSLHCEQRIIVPRTRQSRRQVMEADTAAPLIKRTLISQSIPT